MTNKGHATVTTVAARFCLLLIGTNFTVCFRCRVMQLKCGIVLQSRSGLMLEIAKLKLSMVLRVLGLLRVSEDS